MGDAAAGFEADAELVLDAERHAEQIDRVELQHVANLHVIGKAGRPLPRFLLEHIPQRLAELLAIHARLPRLS